MNLHDYRWQDRVIPPRRSLVDLIAALLILSVLAVASVGHNAYPKDRMSWHATGQPLSVEQAPSLHEAARPRVLPKRAEDWLDRREVIEPQMNERRS